MNIATPVDWQEMNYGRGISEDLKEKIRNGEICFPYPCPEPEGDVSAWAQSLNPQQTFQAFYDYHEKWTWETGCFYDKHVLDTLEEKISREYNRPAKPGMVYFDSYDEAVYVFDGKKWIEMTRNQVVDD